MRMISAYIPRVVLPVASPKLTEGLLRTAPATIRAAWRLKAAKSGSSSTSMVFIPPGALTEAANQQSVATRPVQAQDVDDGFALVCINELTHAKKRRSPGDGQQLGGFDIRRRHVNLFIRIGELYTIPVFQRTEERAALQRCGD